MHNSFPNRSARLLIRLYQKWISPYKGWKCAHERMCGGLHCSAYGMKMFCRHDAVTATRLTWRRMRKCGAVYRDLVSKMSPRQLHRHECARGYKTSPGMYYFRKWKGEAT